MSLRAWIPGFLVYLFVTVWTVRAGQPEIRDPQLQNVVEAFQQGKMKQAAELAEAYTEAVPLDAQGWYWFGDAALHLGRVSEAQDALARAVLLRPDYTDAYRQLGLAEFRLGNAAAAGHAWQVAVSLNPKDERSKVYLGSSLYQQGNTKDAEGWLEQALAENSSDPQALLFLGLCEQQFEHADRARDLLEKAVSESVAQHAPAPEAFYALAESERRAKHADAALALLEQAAELCPEAHAMTALADLYKDAHRNADAERVLRRAVALNPNLPEAHYKLALLLKASQKPEESRAELAAFERTRQQSVFPKVEK